MNLTSNLYPFLEVVGHTDEQTFRQIVQAAFRLIVELQQPILEFDEFESRRLGSCAELSDFDMYRLVEVTEKVQGAVIVAHEMRNGAESVARIVRAMKDFSHPGTSELVEVDLNTTIKSVATISRNEWKYVAELKLDLDESIPSVPCYVGELNQAILNVIVNAAHAIEDALKVRGEDRGILTVSTRHRESEHEVDILVTDTGTGIPEELQSRIFEPFFTTKEVGRGSGQGLAIVYATIVKKHRGKLHFKTQLGVGTTFIITLDTRLGKNDGMGTTLPSS